MIKKSIPLIAVPVLLSVSLMNSCGKADTTASEKSPRDNWGLTPLGPKVQKPQWKRAPIKRELKTNFKSLPATGQPLALASNGKANAVLVLAQKPNASEQQAAQLLQRVFAEISGAKPAIVSEDKANEKIPIDGQSYETLISIGDTQFAKAAGINADDLKLDGYRLQTRGNTLFLVGRDSSPMLDKAGKPVTSGGTGPTHYVQANGTRNGAYALLERHFGCRWLWPSEAGGEVLPKRNTLTLPPINESDEPAIAQRGIRNYYPENRTNAYGRRQQQSVLPLLNRSYSEFLKKAKNSGDWFDAMKLGQSFELNLGHSYGDYWKQFGETHREYFALQADGTRNQVRLGESSASRAHLDVSNPELIQHIAEEAIAKFDADPNLTSVSIAPNDGSYPSFCLCEVCRRLDPPNGDPVSFSIVDQTGEASRIQYVSLSDRYVLFYSKIAEIVAKKHPGRLLGAYAYSTYSSPPLYAKLPSNVVISYVGLSYFNDAQRNHDLQSWDQWSQMVEQLQLRPNALLGNYGIAANYAHKLGADIKHTYQTGMIGTDFDALTHDWAARGLNDYVLAKLLWDPSQDIDVLIADYCDAGFGPASPAIQKYFARLEELTNAVAKAAADSSRTEDGIDPNSRNGGLLLLSKIYTPEKLAELQSILDDAKKQAGQNEAVLKRIEFLEQAIRYANAETNWLRAYFAPASPDKKRNVLEALEARHAVLVDIYDRHFYAQSPFSVMYREASMFKEYDWQPKKEQ
jgi:hypothetical protein